MSNYAPPQTMTKIAKVYYSTITILNSDLVFLEHFGNVVNKQMLRGKNRITHSSLAQDSWP